MPLSSGEKFGPYDIVAKLGAGGMGEVYKAHDPKLNRDVAIKVLPIALANDADYLARFQREAQTLAALNHPNIATIFGLEGRGIVMEFVEGQTLRGPLPLADALAIARQIAEALEAAHEKNIIHRDLKPGNVMVTAEGVVKVLDFGLAKAVSERPVVTGPDSPTLTLRATEAGLILGTAGYMSPEQAAGKQVDRRADIWSFGVVLHELLTGARLFDGETVSHTLAGVLKDEIDLTKIPEGPVRDLVRRCLDRNIKNRLQHIGEARVAIDSYAEKPAPKVVKPPSRLPWYIAAAAVLAAGAAWIVKPNAPVRTIITEISPPSGGRFSPINNTGGSAISPDGRTLAFVATDAKGIALLHVRSLDSLSARALPGTEDAGRPFWSPDSKSLGFVSGGKLKRIDIAGGAPITLCDTRFGRGADWSEDGVILFGDFGSAIQRISSSGGTPTPVTQRNSEAGDRVHYYPQFLPGGKQFLYLVRGATETQGIYLGSLDGKPPVRILPTEYCGRYDASTRRLLYIQGTGTLMSRKLVLDPPGLVGDPTVVAESVRSTAQNGFAEFSTSAEGTLFYGRGNAVGDYRFTWLDRTGKALDSIGEPQQMQYHRLSPDGRRFAYVRPPDVWTMDALRGLGTRLTFVPGPANSLEWSPDGRQIYFTTVEGLYRKAADGSGSDELLWKSSGLERLSGVSPDGKHLLVGNTDISVFPLIGERKPVPYLDSKAMERSGVFSPDGRWVAYTSDESGRTEVYVQGFPERRGKWPVSGAGGTSPVWRADGKEIYWLAPGDTVTAASIGLQSSGVTVGKPEALFRLPDAGTHLQSSRDGKQFLVVNPVAGAKDFPMVVVQNWAARLGR